MQYNLKQQLAHFTGTSVWYRHALNPSVTYTEGVQYFAQHAGNGAYWLLDILATEPAILQQAREFAYVKLTVTGSSAHLIVTDGNSDVPVFNRGIDFTDCPEGVWEFYFTDWVILLTSEY